MNFKQFNPKKHSIKTIYHLMISGIAPRPIALVGSRDNKDHYNLAPFSYFNGFGSNPPIVGFSPTLSGQTGLPKDTLLNIQETKEFTISIVTSDIVGQMSLASCEFNKNLAFSSISKCIYSAIQEDVSVAFTSELISPVPVVHRKQSLQLL